ncbi:MAG: argininosuccinate lyase [Chloroflexi bacterium]|nr:argininosuccinate lyase [Chloroflexota bacterium]
MSTDAPSSHILWGGRFQSGPDPRFWALNASLPVDQRLALHDVRGTAAWVRAIAAAGVLTPDERDALLAGLERIAAEFRQGTFAFAATDEDIHTAIERRLKELVGEPALKVHTGRSRNDQVVTAFRLWLRDAVDDLDAQVRDLQAALVQRAEADLEVLVPGYTHLQQAQPMLLSHWWLAHFWPLHRDRQRLAQIRQRLNVLPLGSGALAGTTVPVDREALARDLGFEAITPNSWDAVSDRDFAAEFLFWAALLGVHLSRLAEGVILFTSREFGFLTLDDAFSSGSSLLPQKKNPDGFELTRGKSGTLIGALTGLLSTLKALPSAYDKDLQEDKAPVFRAYDDLRALLPVLADSLRTLTVHPERAAAALAPDILATDLADYLVAKGIPFREAHHIVGQVVQRAAAQGVPLTQWSVDDFRAVHPAFDADVHQALDPWAAVARRDVPGGTAPNRVRAQLEQARAALDNPL